MIDLPREVQAGEPVSATAYNRLVRAIRAIMPLEGPNIHLRRSPNGTVISGAPGNGGGSAERNEYPAPFNIIEDAQTQGLYRFDKRFFEVSGIMQELSADVTFDFRKNDVKNKYVAIKIDSEGTTILAYASLAAMQSAMQDSANVVIPLYKFDNDGNVECDLRHMPRADMWALGAGGTSQEEVVS